MFFMKFLIIFLLFTPVVNAQEVQACEKELANIVLMFKLKFLVKEIEHSQGELPSEKICEKFVQDSSAFLQSREEIKSRLKQTSPAEACRLVSREKKNMMASEALCHVGLTKEYLGRIMAPDYLNGDPRKVCLGFLQRFRWAREQLKTCPN